MKQQKKLFLLIISIILVFGLSACGSEEEPEETEPGTVEETETETETEDPVDPDDLLNTLDWQDDEEKILSFKDEVVTGYDISIGTAFYDSEANQDDDEESEDSEEDTSDIESPYNILQWQYAEHETTEYLLLEYSYDNDNFKVVFYKDKHDNTNVAELYINLDKQEEKVDIKEWSDSVFIIEEPEPETEEETEPETKAEEPKQEETTASVNHEIWDGSKYIMDGAYVADNGNKIVINGSSLIYTYNGSESEGEADSESGTAWQYGAGDLFEIMREDGNDATGEGPGRAFLIDQYGTCFYRTAN